MIGDGCNIPHYVPDVFLMSIILFMGTFLLSIELKDFKNALFFPSKVKTYALIKGEYTRLVLSSLEIKIKEVIRLRVLKLLHIL